MRSLAFVALAVTAFGCVRDPARARISIRGSDSEVNLVQRLAEVFMADHPDVFVAVTGGGSGVGIASLIDGTCDLANSSRPLSPEEKLLALRSGVDPHAQVFATDALTLIVHADNRVPDLTLDEVGRLFRGEAERWTELGGPDVRVVTYGRQTSSGTYAWFQDAVVKGEYDPEARQMNGSAQIVDSVARDPGGIGYVAVGYLKAGAKGVRAMPIREGPEHPPVDPLDDQAVLAGDYPVARPLFQISDGPPEGALAEFIRFERSEAGQEVTMEMGFFPPIPNVVDEARGAE